jgi:hypothetical protein
MVDAKPFEPCPYQCKQTLPPPTSASHERRRYLDDTTCSRRDMPMYSDVTMSGPRDFLKSAIAPKPAISTWIVIAMKSQG